MLFNLPYDYLPMKPLPPLTPALAKEYGNAIKTPSLTVWQACNALGVDTTFLFAALKRWRATYFMRPAAPFAGCCVCGSTKKQDFDERNGKTVSVLVPQEGAYVHTGKCQIMFSRWRNRLALKNVMLEEYRKRNNAHNFRTRITRNRLVKAKAHEASRRRERATRPQQRIPAHLINPFTYRTPEEKKA